MTLRIRIASRKSNLAIRQVEILKEHLSKDIEINIIEVVTSGDKTLDKSLADIGGKGLFIKELENTILKDGADVAVHSMKDMETELAANTKIAGVLPRGSRSDVLLGQYSTLDDLPDSAVIGTSSVRRGAFAKSYRPDLQIKLLRGNVGTRIDKLNNGVFDAIILAKAGLDRLNINIGHIIPKEIIPPASTQGIIAVQSTTNKKTKLETTVNKIFQDINDANTYSEALAERSLLRTLDGTCRSPISSSAYVVNNDELILYGAVAKQDGSKVIKSEIKGARKDSIFLGIELGKELIAKSIGESIFD